jgi:dipeptidyl aminopeptidase/acylaminoacyl peptidase
MSRALALAGGGRCGQTGAMSWTRSAMTCFGVAAAVLASHAPAAPVGDLAAALAMPVAGGLAGAAQARRFAWVENVAGVRNVWVGGPGWPARALTGFAADDGQEIYDLAWRADGTRLAFVRGGDAEFPDGGLPNAAHATEPAAQQVWEIAADGGEPVLVGAGHDPVYGPDGSLAFVARHEVWLRRVGAAAERVLTIAGEASNLQWSPDGRRLLFVEDRGDHAFAALWDVGVASVRYLAPGLDAAIDPVFSLDGSQVAFVRAMDPPASGDPHGASYWSIVVADAGNGTARTLWRAPAGPGGQWSGTRQQNLWWSADGRVLFPWERDGWRHVYAIDAKTGEGLRELTPGAFEVETFLLAADRRTLMFIGNPGDSDRHALYRVAGDGKAVRVGAGDAIESYPVLAGDAVAVVATDVSHPAHVVLADGAALGPAGELADAVAPIPVTFAAEDGGVVHAQIYPGKGPGPHPALVFLHGGPLRQMLAGFHPSGYYSNAYVLNQHFAARGVTVLAVNYRSGTGYGHAFREAADVARGGAAEYRDVLAAGRWLAARGDVDARRIGVWGGSWGGYLTALALARDSELFVAGVDFHGVHTMLRPASDSLSPDAQAKARALQWVSSPFGALATWRSPVLLIHGDDDHNVDFAQSLLLARELTARGVRFEELVFPDERHGFLRYADWLASIHATEAFLARELKVPAK